MTNKVKFFFHFPSCRSVSIVVAALSPEITHKIPKAIVAVSQDDKILKLAIESDDLSSLRAACNSYLRWVQTALAVEELV